MAREKKADRRQQRTRRQIREAFIALLTEKQTGRLTITELAEKADIDRKTFYLHYGSLEDLLEEIQNEFLEELHLLVEEFDLFQPSFDALAFFRKINAIIDCRADLYHNMMKIDQYQFFYGKLQTTMKELLRQKYHRQLERSPVSLVKLSLYVEYTTAGILAVYMQWLAHPEYDLEEVAEAASEIAYGGGRAVLERIREVQT